MNSSLLRSIFLPGHLLVRALFALGALLAIVCPAAGQAPNTFANTGNLAAGRYAHSATVLPSGKVLVVGGFSGSSYLASTEIYDPATGAWTVSANLPAARRYHTATLLPNGKVLIAGGSNASGNVVSAELYDPVAGTWTTAGNLATPRRVHTATLLPSGDVLVAGGYNGSAPVTSAEIYDLASGTWTPTGSLSIGRWQHTATLLANGKVLVAGGSTGSSSTANAELYDPATGTWTPTGNLATARFAHTATLLPSGKVLLAGGAASGSVTIASAELYDPVTGTCTAAASLAGTRGEHTATLLPNGKVLVAGGHNSSAYHSSSALYDSTSGTWSSTGSPAGRRLHTATLLPNGKVLVTGGENGSTLASSALYEPASSTWTTTGNLAAARRNHTSTLLRNGTVIVAGGLNVAGADLYDPVSGLWTATGSLAAERSSHSATLLPDGKVLVAGGAHGSGPVVSAEVYDPASGTWTATGSLAAARSGHTATLLPNGRVLVAGGINGASYLASAELYDPGSGTWTVAASLAGTRGEHTATLLPNGKVLVIGGSNGSGKVATAELYDLASGTWTSTGSLATARCRHTATLLPNGKLLVAGGSNVSGPVASAELYNPGTGTWASTASLAAARDFHTATLLRNGKVLVAGGFNGSSSLASGELYDPAFGTWTTAGSFAAARDSHTATLLPNGKVLVAAGYNRTSSLASATLYDQGQGYSSNWQPQIAEASFNASGQIILSGTRFTGISGAASGNCQDSPTNYPVVQLHWLENGESSFLSRDATASAADTAFISATGAITRSGHALVTVFANGIPSHSSLMALASVPGAPTIGTATPGNASASVAFTTPANNGGSEIIQYTVTASPGGITATGTASPITVNGLTNGTAYTFTVTATNAVGAGAASEASNSVTPATAPGEPTIGVASGGNASASVAFTAPANDGGSEITGYTVTSNPGGITATGPASPIMVNGLTNGTAYTFTVTATNAAGTGAASAASNSVTPATIPGAPTIGVATGGNAFASVAFTAPDNDGGSAITGYTVTASPGGVTATGPASPIVVNGLTNGTAYTFTVTATNAAGDSVPSSPSNSVTVNPVDPSSTLLFSKGGVVPSNPEIQAGAKWTGFGSPAINDGGNVAVIGKWSAPAVTGSTLLPAQSGTGIFLNDALLIKVGQPVPGAGTNGLPPDATFKKFKDPVLDQGGHVAFVATIKGSGVTSINDTVVVSNGRTGALEVLAREGDPAPGVDGAVFKTFSSVSIQGETIGGTMFTAALLRGSGTPAATSGNDTGAWWLPAGETATIKMLREGDPGFASGETIKTFQVLKALGGSPGHGRGQIGGDGALVQVTLVGGAASRQSQLLARPGILEEYATTGDVLGGTALPSATWSKMNLPSSGNSGANISVLGLLTGNVGGVIASAAKGIFASEKSGETWDPVMRVGDAAPGIAGATFSAFKDPVNSGTGAELAFIGAVKGGAILSTNNEGIWFRSHLGPMTLVAREGDQPPGAPPGAKWKSFRSLALPGNESGPVFTAFLQKGINGSPGPGGITGIDDFALYAVDGLGALIELIREGQPLAGKVVKTFSVLNAVSGSAGATRSFNANGQVVVYVAFTDGSRAIVRIDVP